MKNKEAENKSQAAQIWAEYRRGVAFKEGLGSRGLYEQNKMNERYLIGDQWHGVNCGNDKPLVRHNIIKRIADYKMAFIGSGAVSVQYSAEGVPFTSAIEEQVIKLQKDMAKGDKDAAERLFAMTGWNNNNLLAEEIRTEISDEEVNFVMNALSNYFQVTSERVRLDELREQALRNAYCSGTGVLYTWWDDSVETGLFADGGRKVPVCGDICCEVLDIENVYFGDPNMDDIQSQPYIIAAQRKSVDELRREAGRYGASEETLLQILPENDTSAQAGQLSEQELADSQKAVVLTRFSKVWDKDGQNYTLKAVKVCGDVVIRPEWDMCIRLYPFSKFNWERRRSCVYGESEITYLIPNQIAINRMITAGVWAAMMTGMPALLVNSDLIGDEITNDPGQIIRINGDVNDVSMAAKYLNPPGVSQEFNSMTAALISNTLIQSGANSAALGDLRPDNAQAIEAVREAATLPLQTLQNRYYGFIEETARIWAEFWVSLYARRSIRLSDRQNRWHFPFDGNRYRGLVLSARVDVNSANVRSDQQVLKALNDLFEKDMIDTEQYLSRLPKGTVPNLDGLIRESKGSSESVDAM